MTIRAGRQQPSEARQLVRKNNPKGGRRPAKVIPPEEAPLPWRDQLRLVRRRLARMARPEADDTEVIPPEEAPLPWRDQLRLVRRRLAGRLDLRSVFR